MRDKREGETGCGIESNGRAVIRGEELGGGEEGKCKDEGEREREIERER